MNENLTLYHFMGCPFCAVVQNYLESRNISIPMKDIRQQPAFRDELIKIGGKTQVPCLVINGKALYESDEIIQWFKENWKG